MKDDAISRQAVLKLLSTMPPEEATTKAMLIQSVKQMSAAQPECAKEFVMLKVIDLNGRPYYSIIYLEDGREYEGYSSYDLMVISEYIKRYFGFAQPEIIRCKDCKHNPKESWFGCPMSHLSEEQRPGTAWCWRAERREVSE